MRKARHLQLAFSPNLQIVCRLASLASWRFDIIGVRFGMTGLAQGFRMISEGLAQC
jgi:hypothetical protein